MSIAEMIFEQAKDLPEPVQQQILDFTAFMKEKTQREFTQFVEHIMTENEEAFRELAK